MTFCTIIVISLVLMAFFAMINNDAKNSHTLGDIDPKKSKLTFDIQQNGFGRFRVIVHAGPNFWYTLKSGSACDNTFGNISQVHRAIEEWKDLQVKSEFKLIKTVE